MRRVRLIPLLLCMIASPAAAQWQLSGDLGLSHLRQAALPESNALTFGGAADLSADRFALRSTALGARTSDSRITGQWIGAGVVASPTWQRWTLQATGAVSAFGQSNLRPTTSADLVGQARIDRGTLGAAIGGGAGATSHNAVTIPDVRALADAWWSPGAERFTVNATLTRTRAVFGESTILVDISNRVVSYRDLAAGWRHEAGSWTLGASYGGRQTRTQPARAWHSVDAEAWIAPHAALTASVGKTLEDLVRGVPKAEYATIGLRWSGQPHLTLSRSRAPTGPRLIALVERDGSRVMRLVGVSATSVEIMADFTDWAPVPLEKSGGEWIVKRSISPGLHKVAIRIDGGEWKTPANLPRVEDDLGGVVGLITVP